LHNPISYQFGIRALVDQVARMGSKKSLQEIEENNLALQMENIELGGMLEIDEEEKRHMHFVF